MSNLLKISLGILTSFAGFLEVGSIGTSLQAGAAFRYGLLWPIALGGICIGFLTEMTGRLAAVSHITPVNATRERFGVRYHLVALFGQVIVNLLVLGAEIAGVAVALQLTTGIDLRVWALPVALLIWFLLWRGSFQLIEHGVAILGLVTLCFVVGALRLGPDWGAVGAGLVPHLPEHDRASYAFLAVGILGATISPYLISFYSSGAIEEHWKERDLPTNRLTAAMGMGFGAIISMAVLIVAAEVLSPRGILVEQYHQTGPVLSTAFRHWGFFLFVSSLAIGCFGAALELTLDTSYIIAQAFGWTWGEDLSPIDDSRFSLVWTTALGIAPLFTLVGIDPLQLTMVSMAITALSIEPPN